MENFAIGDEVFITRSGMPSYIGRVVRLIDSVRPGEWTAQAVGDWLFPHGMSTATLQDRYISHKAPQ